MEPTSRIIAILEDDEGRQQVMLDRVARLPGEHEAMLFDSAPEMCGWLAADLDSVAAISLDHDLVPSRQRGGVAAEPGTGRDVVDFLVGRPPSCPVLLHTANLLAAPGMMMALEMRGWRVRRIPPYGELEWIVHIWEPALREELGLPRAGR